MKSISTTRWLLFFGILLSLAKDLIGPYASFSLPPFLSNNANFILIVIIVLGIFLQVAENLFVNKKQPTDDTSSAPDASNQVRIIKIVFSVTIGFFLSIVLSLLAAGVSSMFFSVPWGGQELFASILVLTAFWVVLPKKNLLF
ncbi:MAG: hypothetical protein AAFU78_20135 [Cyanobacteria bacterium J06633_2]